MASNPKIKCRDMRGKVAVVTGGSRGIGRECCLALARAGCHVAVLAKSTTDTPNLPGTIFTVAKECEEAGKAHGVEAIGVKCDLRDVENCLSAVETVAAKWGRCAALPCLPSCSCPCSFVSCVVLLSLSLSLCVYSSTGWHAPHPRSLHLSTSCCDK